MVKMSKSSTFQALNHFVIFVKYHSFLSWLNKASPSFEFFSFLLKERSFVNVQLLLNSEQNEQHYVHEIKRAF